MAKRIRFEKSVWGQSASVIIFDKISFYCGTLDHWGIGVEVSFYHRSLTFKILNLYTGFEVYHKQLETDDY